MWCEYSLDWLAFTRHSCATLFVFLVQLAFSDPRSRILVFHTGRIVGTGCDSAQAARLAVARAQRQIALEAGIYLRLRNFAVRSNR